MKFKAQRTLIQKRNKELKRFFKSLRLLNENLDAEIVASTVYIYQPVEIEKVILPSNYEYSKGDIADTLNVSKDSIIFHVVCAKK